MRPAKTTIRDVAAEAGVSVTTVSHALNTERSNRVNEATRERVQQAAARLGYAPNGLARGLRRQRSQTLALLSDTIATTPHAGQIILGAQEKASELGYVLMLYSSGADADVEEREVRSLLQQQVDGVLYATMYHRNVMPPTELRVLPMVLLDCASDDPYLPSVIPDEQGTAANAVQELLDHGHRRIGFVTNIDDVPATHGRLLGYREALSQAGITFDPELVASDISETPGGYRTATKLLTRSERPTAIFAYNDRMAMGVYRAARELGIDISTDLSVISIDNQRIIAEGLYPELTSMELPHYEMGAWAVDQLVGKLESSTPQSRQPVEPMILPCPIFRRNSISAPRPAVRYSRA